MRSNRLGRHVANRLRLAARVIVLLTALGAVLPLPYDSEPGEGGGNPLLLCASMCTVLFILVRVCCNPRNRVFAIIEAITYALYSASLILPVVEVAWNLCRGKPAEPLALFIGGPVTLMIVGAALLLIKDSVVALRQHPDVPV